MTTTAMAKGSHDATLSDRPPSKSHGVTLPPGHAEWLARQERTKALRDSLAAARAAGKRQRHERRLALLAARERP